MIGCFNKRYRETIALDGKQLLLEARKNKKDCEVDCIRSNWK